MAVIDELAQRFNQQQGLPPVNPEAFSGRQQQAGAPAGMQPQGPQQAAGFDPTSSNSMQEYLINKVMELKRNMRPNMGALDSFTSNMRDMRRVASPNPPAQPEQMNRQQG